MGIFSTIWCWDAVQLHQHEPRNLRQCRVCAVHVCVTHAERHWAEKHAAGYDGGFYLELFPFDHNPARTA